MPLTREDKEFFIALIQPLRDDVAELKQDVAVLKQDVAELKQDVAVLKHEVSLLKQEVVHLKKRVATIETRLSDNDDYRKNESIGIEHEINHAVKPHLKNEYQGQHVVNFPLKSIRDPESNRLITEFDGAFLVQSPDKSEAKLIIVEAKHIITTARINTKLVQMSTVNSYIEKARVWHIRQQDPSELTPDDIRLLERYTDVTFTRQFEASCKQHKLYTIKDVFLYVGGPIWDDYTVKYCNDINNGITEFKDYSGSLTKDQQLEILNLCKGHIGTIVPQGVRYKVSDALSVLNEGGGKKKTLLGPYMRYMPNFINHQFT